MEQHPLSGNQRKHTRKDSFKRAQLPQSEVDQVNVKYLKQVITKVDLTDENIDSILK